MKRIHPCAAWAAVALLSWGLSDRPQGVLAGGPRAGYFPNVILRTQDNKEVRFYDDLIRGKTVLINFMYTRCEGVCLPGTENLVQVQKLLGDRVGSDVFMYSISLDPENDNPAVLKDFAKSHGVKPGWLFLTGKAQDIDTLRKKLGVADPDPKVDKDKSQHSGLVRIGNEAIDKWAATPVISKANHIVRLVNRMKPFPETPSK